MRWLTSPIFTLQDFPDGQIMWGTEPIKSPYTGDFAIADYFVPQRYDIYTVRAIANRLDAAGDLSEIENELLNGTPG